MEQQQAFQSVATYTQDSIQRCQHLAEFIKKRQAIEEDYARALRKLCKSVSLTPLQQQQQQQKQHSKRKWSWLFWRKVEDTAEASPFPADTTQTTLWSTFYELIDDTSQVAKSHTALAESLQRQLLEPLSTSIREMEQSRNQTLEQGNQLIKNMEDTTLNLKKAGKKFTKTNKEAIDYRSALEKLHQNRTVGMSKDLEKLQKKTRKAEEDFSLARQALRQQEESLKNLHSKLYSQELPRLMLKLQQQEVQRSREALSYILGLIELERRCAVMNENYAGEMALKLKQINLLADEQKFSDAFMSVPVALPLSNMSIPMTLNTIINAPASPPTIATNPTVVVGDKATGPLSLPIPSHFQPTATVVTPTLEIPRTLSMPPAYESQTSTALTDLAHHGGAVSTHAISTVPAMPILHHRNLTAEIPSQP